jgi:hypothetical protein
VILTVAIVAVLVLAVGVIVMTWVGAIGLLSESRLIANCPECGRWELDLSGLGLERTCAHCRHPGRVHLPALVHTPGTAPHPRRTA